jgi:hypothetical protein
MQYPKPPLIALSALLLPALLDACSTVPNAPKCDESAYRSLNPAHYDPVKESTRADVPFLLPKA